LLAAAPFLVDLLLHPVQNMYQNPTPLQGASNYLSIEWLFASFGFRMKTLRLFYSLAAICPENFRTRSVERFRHNPSLRSPKLVILDVLERRLDGASK
jgi:hypothetical protein